jgi:hypothetical protein
VGVLGSDILLIAAFGLIGWRLFSTDIDSLNNRRD